jgi:hypothetical protein
MTMPSPSMTNQSLLLAVSKRMLSGGMIMKKSLALALVLMFVSSTALAFHDGGVARCSGCHTMHNSQNGVPVDPDSPNGNPWLLNKGTPSDTCLNCHAQSRGGFVYNLDPLNPIFSAAGSFVFLLEDNLNDSGRGAAIPGDAAGHNIIAPAYGLGADATLTSAPGGTFPASQMACSSCHDPHGRDTFRLLYGVGAIQDGLYTFTAPAPQAVGTRYGSVETASNHTAYQAGMSAWCGNCHGDYHTATTSKIVHPSGTMLGATIATNYNLYNGTDDVRGGNAASAYLTLVPFEDVANTDIASTAGPSASSRVMCLSCHRAHASSGPDAGRWDFTIQFMNQDGVASGSFPIPNPYLSDNQRSLCNKCHVKDEFDAPFSK